MHNLKAASKMVSAHGRDAVGKVIIQIFEQRLLNDQRSEAVWTSILGAVLEIQTLRLKRDIH